MPLKVPLGGTSVREEVGFKVKAAAGCLPPRHSPFLCHLSCWKLLACLESIKTSWELKAIIKSIMLAGNSSAISVRRPLTLLLSLRDMCVCVGVLRRTVRTLDVAKYTK